MNETNKPIGAYDKWIFPVIKNMAPLHLPWYKNLWRWATGKPRYCGSLDCLTSVQPMSGPGVNSIPLYVDYDAPAHLVSSIIMIQKPSTWLPGSHLSKIWDDGYEWRTVGLEAFKMWVKNRNTSAYLLSFLRKWEANSELACFQVRTGPSSWASLSGREWLILGDKHGNEVDSQCTRMN